LTLASIQRLSLPNGPKFLLVGVYESEMSAIHCEGEREEMTDKKTERIVEHRSVEEPASTASPAATGPAGARLEGHVGAQYLLPLLTGGEARGLPGAVVTRVAFQRAGLGNPMDDIVVSGTDRRGDVATLEVQAKRTVSFSIADSVFKDVVKLACRASAKSEFETSRYELAVAVARTSAKIEQHVQEVLKWARDYQDYEQFFRRVNQHGVAHDAMRNFVAAFRAHMRAAGAMHNDRAVWRLLSRFQVLAFDFEQHGSICTQLARDRCALALATADTGRAGELWDSLQQIALEVDAAGGDMNARVLRDRLTLERGFRFAGDRRLHDAREALSEAAGHILEGIRSTVREVRVERSRLVLGALNALQQGRYLEIRGPGGVGKSAVLKDLALLISVESRVIVVAPNRVPPGGWSAMQSQIGCEATAIQFFTDLAGDGGGVLFIDRLDRFDDLGQRETIADLIRTAAKVRGFRIVTTTRADFDSDSRSWLPLKALDDLVEAPPLEIEELSDDEVAQLRSADPALAKLLRSGHPARKLARNLYRLERLARDTPVGHAEAFSEAQMALQWWKSGDGAEAVGRLDRRRVLRSLAIHSLRSSSPMDTSAIPSDAIASLIWSGTLSELSAVLIEPAHDVLLDWAIGCLLYEEPQHWAILEDLLQSRVPARLMRGVEIAARLYVESGKDTEKWRALLDRVSIPTANGSWRRAVLLAPARSEKSTEALTQCLPQLDANDGQLLAEIVRTAIVVDSQPASPLFAGVGIDTTHVTGDFIFPRGPTWMNLIVWLLANGDRLPPDAVPQIVELYSRWCMAFAGRDTWSPLLVKRLHTWLVEVEVSSNPSAAAFEEWMAAKAAPKMPMSETQERSLRTAFLSWCVLCPDETKSYLQGLAIHPNRHVVFRELLKFIGTAAYASPLALADLFLQTLPEGASESGDRGSLRESFPNWDLEYLPASPAHPPFLDLLKAEKEQGLRLIRGIVGHAIRRRTRGVEPGANQIRILFPGGPRAFPWRQFYMMSRSDSSYILLSALMALEAWAHWQIERGEPLHGVIEDVLGPEGSATAYLLVAIDVMLSHWPKSRECLSPFAASAELLALDRSRFTYDQMGDAHRPPSVRPEPDGDDKANDLQRLSSRGMPLDFVLSDFAHNGPADVRELMQRALQDEVTQSGRPDEDSPGVTDPRFMAQFALNRLDAQNYVARSESENREVFDYVSPSDEAKRFAHIQHRFQSEAEEVSIIAQIAHALTKTSCPAELLDQAVRWANQDSIDGSSVRDREDRDMIERAKLTVAALVMRDGSEELKSLHGQWASAELNAATTRELKDHGVAKAIAFNPLAIAFIGLLASVRDESKGAHMESLLRLAARRGTNIADVLRGEVAAGRSLSPELTRSFIRLALGSAIYAVRQRRNLDLNNVDDYHAHNKTQEAERKQADHLRQQIAIEAEQNWLFGKGSEPPWPELPDPSVRSRSNRAAATLPSSTRALALDDAAAAVVLSLAVDLWRVEHPDLLGALVRHCWPWTATANGVGRDPSEGSGERAFEWNHAYFGAALAAAISSDEGGVGTYLLDPLGQLPELQFLHAVEPVLHALDQRWLGDNAVSDGTALALREALAQRLQATSFWRRLAAERSSSISTDAAGAVAAMFMGESFFGKGPKCYVLPPGAARANLFLPTLTQMAEQVAGSTFVALAFLSLLEVDPQPSKQEFLSRVVTAWWAAQNANAEFWISYGIGSRLCDWVDKVLQINTASSASSESKALASIVDILVRSGVPMARPLEERLEVRRNTDDH
jgi:hypothetical protein